MKYTPTQLAVRYRNASTKLGTVTDILASLNDAREHGESLATYANTAHYYLDHVCDILDRTAKELDAGHTRTVRNKLVGTRVVYGCICGYEADSDDKLTDHISYMVTTVGESNSAHGSR